MFATDDTIVAISTPHGRGGIGIVRLSGPDATRIAVALLQPDATLHPRQATFGRVHDPATGERIDQVVATWFPSPHSYTGDDVVEISGHGSPVVLGAIVKAAVDCGARPAEPGEFTLRAYLNGRIDLAQAEAVADLVDAVTPLQARAALDQLEGTLTSTIRRIDAALFDLCARLEASLDFPDEGFHFISRPETIAESGRLTQELDRLLEDGRAGRVIREGRTVVILGRPNAGKSSLFNALAGAARAIVTEIPGTTRDLITERIDVNGLALTLVDTAGLREARDAIEAEGVRRAQQAQQVAALNLIVVDGSETLKADERELVRTALPPVVVVQSKADLPRRWAAADLGRDRPDVIEVSSVTNAGLAELRAAMARALLDREERRDPPMITNIRHLALVEAARDSVVRARQALESGSTEELILTDLTQARQHLEEIAGRRTAEDLLRHIFTRFCIGK